MRRRQDKGLHKNEAGPSRSVSPNIASRSSGDSSVTQDEVIEDRDEDAGALEQNDDNNPEDELGQGMHPEGYAGPASTVKPISPEALAAFRVAQERAGIVYISRIPPGMRPTKVRHLMSQYGEIGRVYLQQEDPKRAYLRKKYTSTKKPHFTEGWVEFSDKRVARSVAGMLNARPIGGKKGTRWRDDVWTMKYLPRFKWNMLTEQIANEAAVKTARLRVELEQSRREQKDYLRQVELARVLDKRAKRKREVLEKKGEQVDESALLPPLKKAWNPSSNDEQMDKERMRKKRQKEDGGTEVNPSQLKNVLSNVF